MMRTLIFALSLGLAGCSLLGTDEPTDALPFFLTQAQADWETVGPPRYEFAYAPADGFTTYLILVERGEVTRVREQESGATVSLALGVTVEELFDRLADAYRTGAYLIEAEYTPQSGYPRYVFVDPSPDVDGDEYGWTISSLRSLISCPGC